MRSELVRVLKQTNVCRNSLLSTRTLTTTSEPKKSVESALRVKEEPFARGTVLDSIFPPLPLPNTDVFTHTFQKANKWQHKTLSECAVTGRKFTYGQTMDGALRWAAALKNMVPRDLPNPVVAFIAPNSPEYITMMYGTFAANMTVCPINPLYTPEEIAYQLKDSGASLIVIDALVEPLADVAFKFMSKPLPIIVNGVSKYGRPNAQEIFADPSAPMADPSNIDPNSIAFMPYSSGTTGKPKGVCLSHAAITNNMAMYLNEYICGLQDAEGDHQERTLGILPFFHIYGVMATLLSNSYYGGKIVTMPKFDPVLFISTLKKYQLTSLPVVPLLLQFVADCPMISSEDLKNAHSFIVGGSTTPLPSALALKEKAPHVLFQEGYGMTETLLTHITAQGAEKIGYCGHLLTNAKAKITDLDNGDLLPPNTPGELCIQTPSMMSGYHNNEAATRATIDEEGWLHTGDVAISTEEGHYSIIDRIKELIKVKGLQVSPSELEDTLLAHPGIADVGVVGVSHSRLGEAPAAFIIKRDEDLTESAIHQYMNKHLSKHKQLEGGITFVDELPRNQLGKLLRKVLKGMSTKTE